MTTFVIVRKKQPKTYRTRTPYGLCDILNIRKLDNGYLVTFKVTQQQLERFNAK